MCRSDRQYVRRTDSYIVCGGERCHRSHSAGSSAVAVRQLALITADRPPSGAVNCQPYSTSSTTRARHPIMAASFTRRLAFSVGRPLATSRSFVISSALSLSRPSQRLLSASFASSSRRPRLEGEVAIITGGSAGIGRETALLFAQEGAAGLCIVDVNEQAGHETVEELKKQHGVKAIFVKADVSKANEVENVSSSALQPTHTDAINTRASRAAHVTSCCHLHACLVCSTSSCASVSSAS